jgi:hypothetical protein
MIDKDNKNKINLNQCQHCMAKSRKDHGKEIDQTQELVLEQARGPGLVLGEELAQTQEEDLTLE